jgi:uncharacterized surface anchored protein
VQTVTFKREEPEAPTITLEKSGVYDASENKIEWTVTVTPPDGQALDEFTLVDAYSSNQTFVSDSFYNRGTLVSDTALDLTTSNEVSYTFPSDTDGVQTITYKTSPTTFSTENGTAENSIFSNEASVLFGTETLAGPVAATVTTNWISKSGSNVSAGDEYIVKWEVDVTVPEDGTVTGASITDTIPAGMALVENTTYPIQYTPEGESTIDVLSGTDWGTYAYSSGTLTYRLPTDGQLEDAGTLVYYTKLTDPDTDLNDNGTVSVTNNAKLNWTENPDPTNPPADTAEVQIVGSNGLLNKSGGSTTNFTNPGYIQWTITVNSNKINMANAKVEDTVPSGQTLLIDASHPFVVKNGSTEIFSDTAKTATTNYTSSDSFVQNFSYQFPASISSTYTVSYYTQIMDVNTGTNNDVAGLDTLYKNNNAVPFGNSVTLTRDGNSAVTSNPTKTYQSQMIAKSILTAYNYNDHTMQWQVVVNRNQLPITNAVMMDTLPAGMEMLIDATHPFAVLQGSTAVADTSPFITVANGDTSFTYSFGVAETSDKYTISFYTLLTDAALEDQWANTKSFTNNAQLTADEITTSISASATAYIKNPVISKDLTYVSGSDYIDWSVSINAGQIELNNASVTDVLDSGIQLDPDSLKLYAVEVSSTGVVQAAASGTLVTSGYTVDYPTTENSNTLTVNLPEGSKSAYRLEFTTFIIVDDLDFINEATLTGTTESPSGDGTATNVVVNNLWATGGSGSRTLTVYKDDGGSTPVSGAVYQLLNVNKDPIIKSGNPITATTGADGNAVFTNLPEWVFYVKEVSAPEGYLLNLEPFGGSRLSEDMTLQTSDTLALGTVIFTKMTDAGAPLSGCEFTLTGTAFDGATVTMTATSDVDGKVTFSNVKVGNYTIQEVSAPEGYLLSTVSHTAIITTNADAVVVTVSPETITNTLITGNIKVTKTEEDGTTPLQGAELSLYKADNTFVESKTSGVDGTVVFENIPYGDYVIIETAPPTGYQQSTEALTIKVENDGQEHNAGSFVNAKIRGKIQFTKYGIDSLPLQGAEFTLYRATDTTFSTPIATQLSDADGLVLFENVEYGNYVIKETNPPEGYLPTSDVLTVTISTHDITVETTPNAMSNEIIRGNIQFTKYGLNSLPLDGAEFKLYQWDDTDFSNPVATSISDTDGVVLFENIVYGNYMIKETSAPEGYVLSSEVLTATISEHNVTIATNHPTITNQYIFGNITLLKTRWDQTTPVQGAEMVLYKADDTSFSNPVQTIVSGTDGIVLFENVMYGSYVIKETKAPSGYDKSNETLTVTISEHNKTYDLGVFKNAASDPAYIESTIAVKLVDSESKPLVGSKFGLYYGDVLIKQAITDVNGNISFGNLPRGVYTIKQLEAPDNYALSDQVMILEVSSTETQQVEFISKVLGVSYLPKTGDAIHYYVYLFIFAAVLLTFVLIFDKKMGKRNLKTKRNNKYVGKRYKKC